MLRARARVCVCVCGDRRAEHWSCARIARLFSNVVFHFLNIFIALHNAYEYYRICNDNRKLSIVTGCKKEEFLAYWPIIGWSRRPKVQQPMHILYIHLQHHSCMLVRVYVRMCVLCVCECTSNPMKVCSEWGIERKHRCSGICLDVEC